LQPRTTPWVKSRGINTNSERVRKFEKAQKELLPWLNRFPEFGSIFFSTKGRFPFLSDRRLRRDMHGYLATVLRAHDCETLVVDGRPIMYMRSLPSRENSQSRQSSKKSSERLHAGSRKSHRRLESSIGKTDKELFRSASPISAAYANTSKSKNVIIKEGRLIASTERF